MVWCAEKGRGWKMKRSEMMQKMIDILNTTEKRNTTITMNYLEYLKEQKRLVEEGDIDLK